MAVAFLPPTPIGDEWVSCSNFMKKIGAIVRCDTTGLGIQSKEFYDHIPCKALVVDVSRVNQTMKQNHDWYPGAPIVYFTKNNRFPIQVIKDFLKDIQVLVAFETSYDPSIFALCKLMGIKTVLQLNYEFLEYPSATVPPDLFAAPSLWHYDEIPDPKILLPVPVNTKKFKPNISYKKFVHIAGKPAVHDRNGTTTFLNSLRYVKNDIEVTLRCQTSSIKIPPLPSHISIKTDFSNQQQYQDNYSGGVLVLPRKYGGLSLVINEAISAMMPVITSNVSPNFTWLPKEWLVGAKKTGSFQCKKKIDIYDCDELDLAAKIDEFCNFDFYQEAVIKTKALRDTISWDNLLPEYYKILLS